MLLAVDAGNSTVAFGLYPNPLEGSPLYVEKLSSTSSPTIGRYKKALVALRQQARSAPVTDIRKASAEPVDRAPLYAVLSSVVPRLNPGLISFLSSLCSRAPLVVSHRTQTGIVFRVRTPSQVGPDRIANAVAASHLVDGPVAVVDCGTATTITVTGAGSEFLGGAIMPGFSLMAGSLHRETARLPQVTLDKPRHFLGRETSTSIASGVVHGTAGAVASIIKGIEKELDFKVQLVLTGGYSALLSSVLERRHRLMPELTFEGLRLIHLRNAHPVP